MPRLIILSGVDDEGVRVDVSRAYASISSNAQCQASQARSDPEELVQFLSSEHLLRKVSRTKHDSKYFSCITRNLCAWYVLFI